MKARIFHYLVSRLWPILQVISHHIQDKLAVYFDSSSIGLFSYKWFLTIDAKFSSNKNIQRWEFNFLERKNTIFRIFQSKICMYILTLSPFLIYEGRSKYCKFFFISHQVHKLWKEPTYVDKRNIDHNYINSWFAVYRWSVIENMSPRHHPTPIPGNVCVWGGILPVCTLLTTSRLRTSRYTDNWEIYQAENVTYIAHA